MKIRDIIKMQNCNDGTRSLFESIMAVEVIQAFKDWTKTHNEGVLIGGLALSYYASPRFTQDIDFLILSKNEIPVQVKGFTRIRDHTFQHNKTHVLVDLITPAHKNIPEHIARKVIETAIEKNGIKIASTDGIIAIKLFRLAMRDKADIISLIKTGHVGNLSEFNLPPEKIKEFHELVEIAKTDPHPN